MSVDHLVDSPHVGSTVTRSADFLARSGLVVVIGWIGTLKFTTFEAQGTAPLVSHRPLIGRAYDAVSVRTFSTLLGVSEVAAVLLAIRAPSPKSSAVDSIMTVGLFVATTRFLFTTPGIGDAPVGGFPVLSMPGRFLIKDVALLGLSVWILAARLRADKRPLTTSSAA
jgi:uncharacterized membrane protein YkgB